MCESARDKTRPTLLCGFEGRLPGAGIRVGGVIVEDRARRRRQREQEREEKGKKEKKKGEFTRVKKRKDTKETSREKSRWQSDNKFKIQLPLITPRYWACSRKTRISPFVLRRDHF